MFKGKIKQACDTKNDTLYIVYKGHEGGADAIELLQVVFGIKYGQPVEYHAKGSR